MIDTYEYTSSFSPIGALTDKFIWDRDRAEFIVSRASELKELREILHKSNPLTNGCCSSWRITFSYAD